VLNQISFNTFDQVSTTVQFDIRGQPLDPTKQTTFPLIGWNPQTVTAHVEAVQGSSKIRVPLVDSFPSAPPPNGYHVTGVSINPPLVELTGPPDVLAKITAIILPAVSLAGYTSDHVFRVTVPPPDPSVTVNVSVANVTYSISKNPAVSPSPSP
jgi:YbbR domain-containing protein